MSDDFLNSLLAGFCLMLVFEGVLPFLAPQQWRETMVRITQSNDQTIRKIGLGSMITGLVLLYLFV
jgi:uncharacterized protein YjeT (DUF2065 family)